MAVTLRCCAQLDHKPGAATEHRFTSCAGWIADDAWRADSGCPVAFDPVTKLFTTAAEAKCAHLRVRDPEQPRPDARVSSESGQVAKRLDEDQLLNIGCE